MKGSASVTWTIGEIKAANAAAGQHFFEPATLRFFRSVVAPEVYQGPGGVYFTTRETNPSGETAHSVRKFYPESGGCMTAPGTEFHAYTPARARKLARACADGTVTAERPASELV